MNALSKAVDLLVNPVAGKESSKEAKAGKESSKVTELSTEKKQSLTELALHCGMELARAGKLEKEAAEIKRLINIDIKIIIDSGYTVGRNGTCAIASAFHKGLVDSGLSKGTADNYLRTFKNAVNTKTPVTHWNMDRVKVEDAATGTAPKPPRAPAEKSLALELLKAFNYKGGNEFKELCFQVEKDFNDDKVKSFYAGFISFLQLHGIEIKEESSK